MKTRNAEDRGCTETAWCLDYLYTEPESEPDPSAVVPVLLLSSDSGFVNHARRSLSRAGFTVVAARSSAEGLQLAAELRFDGLVIDYEQQSCDGIGLFEEIKAQNGGETPPCLVLGERECGALASRCRGAGVAGLHAKSDGVEKLIARLTRLLTDQAKRGTIEQTIGRREQDWNVDSLTGLPSEIYFGRRLLGESMTAAEDRSAVSLLMIVPDRFSRIVERLGRCAADNVLCETARTIQGELRSRDCVARYGDHTFAVILPGADSDGAVAVGRRLRLALSETEFGTLEQPIAATFSIGVASADIGSGIPADDLCSQALRACVGAQSMGGGRVLADAALTGRPLVLVVSPTAADADLVTELTACPVEVRATETLAEAWSALKELPVKMIVVSSSSVGADGATELLAWSRERLPTVKRVLAAERVELGLSLAAINRAGIDHFLSLPVDGATLPAITEELLLS